MKETLWWTYLKDSLPIVAVWVVYHVGISDQFIPQTWRADMRYVCAIAQSPVVQHAITISTHSCHGRIDIEIIAVVPIGALGRPPGQPPVGKIQCIR